MKIEPRFVEFIPEKLNFGILYISVKFRTASHLCASGCGEKIVTPIRPNRWSIKYDGKSVSLQPSIGNFNLECKSHYFIRNNEIVWARGATANKGFFKQLLPW